MPKPDEDIIPLRVPFTIPDGRLAIRYWNDGVALPEEANHRLYLIRKNQVIPILSLRDLRNRVRITSPQAAYPYVSLPTSPRTFYLVDSNSEVRKMNVLPASKLDINYVYGSQELLSNIRGLRTQNMYPELQNGYYGIVDDKRLAMLGIPPVIIKPSRDGFVIRRTLYVDLVSQSHTKKLQSLTQWVSISGEVRTLEARWLPDKMLGNIHWLIPRFL